MNSPTVAVIPAGPGLEPGETLIALGSGIGGFSLTSEKAPNGAADQVRRGLV